MSGAKYFDANESGSRDVDEAGIASWPIQILDSTNTLLCTLTTNGTGGWSSDDCDTSPLLPGTYTIREVVPTNTAVWKQTGNTSNATGQPDSVVGLTNFVYTVTLPTNAPVTVANLVFGNTCYIPTFPGGRTIGFWSNKNGGSIYNLKAANNAGLVTLNLRTNTTTPFNPLNWTQYRDWLLKAQSTVDGVYMLSAQLSATWLNTNNTIGGVPITDPNYQVTWTVAGVPKTQSITGWITDANLFLNGTTFPKATATAYKDLFDAINNNKPLGKTTGTPATCAAPVWPAAPAT